MQIKTNVLDKIETETLPESMYDISAPLKKRKRSFSGPFPVVCFYLVILFQLFSKRWLRDTFPWLWICGVHIPHIIFRMETKRPKSECILAQVADHGKSTAKCWPVTAHCSLAHRKLLPLLWPFPTPEVNGPNPTDWQ